MLVHRLLLLLPWLSVAVPACLSPAAAHSINPGSRQPFKPPQLRVLLEAGSSVVPNITRLTLHGQPAAVAVTRPPGLATASDLVALYVPADQDPRSVLPVAFVNITETDPDWPATGRATVVFSRMLNFRQDFRFRLIGNGTFSPVVFAESRPLFNAIRSRPAQVHLALAADGRSLVVQWVSGDARPQQVVFNHAGQPAVRVASTSRTYTAGHMCGEPASTFGFIHPGHHHTALIPGDAIGHNQTIKYKVGSTRVGWSSTFAFTSPPAPGSQQDFTFLVFNDVGQDNLVVFDDVCPPYCPAGWTWSNYTGNSTKLLKHLLQEGDARLALLVGDLAYANGVSADWDFFGFQFQPAFSRWPLAVAPGNHERHYSGPPLSNDTAIDESDNSGGECGIPYTYRYYTPAWAEQDAAPHGPQPPAAKHAPAAKEEEKQPWWRWQLKPSRLLGMPAKQTPRQPLLGLPQQPDPNRSFYAFAMGSVQFLMLDSESPSDPGSPQREWVEATLAQVDRRAHPWLVVALHRQMVGPTNDPLNLLHEARLQADYSELFQQHRVDLVLQGHDHAYARTCPYSQGSCHSSGTTVTPPGSQVEVVTDAGAPVFILAGHAGAGFTHAFPDPLPDWVRFGAQDRNGYLRVTVSGSRLRVVSVSSDDGSVMDGVELVKTSIAASRDGGPQ